MNGQENTPAPSFLCANGCGFYGSQTTKNLCSKCYREFVKVENQTKQQQQQPESVIRLSATSSVASMMQIPAEAPSFNPQDSEMSAIPDQQLEFPSFVQQHELTDVTLLANPIPATALIEEKEPPSLLSSASTSDSNPVLPGPVPFSRSSSEVASPMTDLSNLTTFAPSSSSHVQNLNSIVSVDNTACSESDISAESEILVCPGQSNKGRCFSCNKKVGLLGFPCRCGYHFCGNHRYADQHNCQFDYRGLARQQLSKANQKVVADKLNRI